MKSADRFDLIDAYTKHTGKYAVHITASQFHPSSRKKFDKLVGAKFPAPLAAHIMFAVTCGDLLVYATEEEARVMFAIMDKHFYAEVYACLSGPAGIITENT